MAQIKYNIEFDDAVLEDELQKITNHIYKLLPLREEGEDWTLPLQTLIVYLTGMNELWIGNQDIFIPLLCKMEGLFSLKQEKDFFVFRRTIFDCLNLMSSLIKKCQKKC